MVTDTKCPDCGHDKFFTDRDKGEVICRNCSFVVEDTQVDFSSETRKKEKSSARHVVLL